MTYSRRKRLREQGDSARVFRTHMFGQKLLNQLFQIICDMDALLGYEQEISSSLVLYLRKEIGVLSLNKALNPSQELYNWFVLEMTTADQFFDLRLDVVELACSDVIDKAVKLDRRNVRNFEPRKAETAYHLVDCVNARMMEDSFGFQFEGGQIIELSSQFSYQEVIEPALGLIAGEGFEAVNSEFRDALDEFKQANYDDCIADCGNAFESTLKVLARRNQWQDVTETDPAAKLLEAAYRHNLIPAYMQSQFAGLRSILLGTPTVRNKEGGHGAGSVPRVVDKHLAAYQLHQTAAAILFLVACSE